MANNKTYNLRTILIAGNYLLCLIASVLYYRFGVNKYVDANTLILVFLFAMQNHVFLFVRKDNDPFILILVPVIMVFYMGRVATLFYDPYSIYLEHNFFIQPNDLNNTMIFILLANTSIFLGLNLPKGKITYREQVPSNQGPARSYVVMAILLLALVCNFSGHLGNSVIDRLAGYVKVSINIFILLLFIFIYLAVNGRKLLNMEKFIIYSLITGFFIILTLYGSRSAVLICAAFLLITRASMREEIRVKKKVILILFILIPFSVILFFVATLCRLGPERGGIDRNNVISDLEPLNLSEVTGKYLPIVFERTGFLDFSTDLIMNEAQYGKVINIIYYTKSVIDRGLTPGFDFWNQPKASQALQYIYTGDIIDPTTEDVNAAYQADMFTVYGEYYVLFGRYIALLVLFICAYLFKIVYLAIECDDIFLFYLFRSLLLYIFYVWINSFGLDWLATDLIAIMINVFLFGRFFRMRKIPNNKTTLSAVLSGVASQEC